MKTIRVSIETHLLYLLMVSLVVVECHKPFEHPFSSLDIYLHIYHKECNEHTTDQVYFTTTT